MVKPRKPSKKNDKKTPKQLAQEKRMAITMEFIVELTELLKITFAFKKKNYRSAYTAFLSHFLKNGFKGEYPDISINFEKVLISTGELEAPKWATATMLENGYLIKWDTTVKNKDRSEDLAIVVKYQPAPYYSSGSILELKRKDGQYFYNANPDPARHHFEFWVGFCNQDKTMCSNSVYARKATKEDAHLYQVSPKQQHTEKSPSHKGSDNTQESSSVNKSNKESTNQEAYVSIKQYEEDLDPKIIAPKIKALREQRGLTQTQLGEMIGKSRNQVGRIESGNQDLTTATMKKILKALNAKIEFRITAKEDEEGT